MSLRDRIAAKQRRRAVVPVQVAAATDDQATRATSLRAELVRAVASSNHDDTVRLTDELAAVEGENSVEVGFTALHPSEFEKVLNAFPAPDGGMDQDKALPVLAALCADDEDLQDDAWWAEQLASGAWSYGERAAIWGALLSINTNAPGAYVPKD
jgi:hypothetical protein